MADGLSIPGVSDKYKTNDLVESLMEVERIPLRREEETLEGYKKQQDAWRIVNQKMSSLRESVRSLYSFENPFNSKISSSSQERSITADAEREASFGSFKIEVVQRAEADRFLSDEIESDFQVPQGKYTFSVGEKKLDITWKGGSLKDFSDAINKRGSSLIKTSLIGVKSGEKAFLIESLKTGEENRLVFENKALDFAKEVGLVGEAKNENVSLSYSSSRVRSPKANETEEENLPRLSKDNVSVKDDKITIGSRGGFELDLPETDNEKKKIEFSLTEKKIKDITTTSSSKASIKEEKGAFTLPSPGSVTYEGISIENNPSDSLLPPSSGNEKSASSKTENKAKPIDERLENLFFIKDRDGNEVPLDEKCFSKEADGSTKVEVNLSDFNYPSSLIVKNINTGKEVTMTNPILSSLNSREGLYPKHAASSAQDAIVKYEGITMKRGSNDIDDIVPFVTLHVHDTTEKEANITIEADTENAKDAIITFVGRYNQTIAEINILSQNKPEIVTELDYLTKDEAEEANERLGMFQGDFSLTNSKSSLSQIVSSNYRFSDEDEITLLAQIGVSTNASGTSHGYSPSQMRGYLEVDEKKLDASLKKDILAIKNIFGFDSDGDLIIDNGIALKLDQQLTSWVQSGGIISTKNSSLDNQIKDSNSKIARLQTQLDRKEAELKKKYTNMEGTLNSLESQQDSMQNFINQNSRNK